jgi:hypothetical protein
MTDTAITSDAVSANAATASSEKDDLKLPRLTSAKYWAGWSKLILLVAAEQNLLTDKTREFSEDADRKQKALYLMLRNMSLDIAAIVPDHDGPKAVFNFWKTEYGSTDVHSLRKDLKSVRLIGVDIQKILSSLSETYGKLRAAGGSVSDSDMIDIILDGVNQEFYLTAIRAVRAYCSNKDTLGPSEVNYTKETLRYHFNDTPVSIRLRYSAYHADNRNTQDRNDQSRNRYNGPNCETPTDVSGKVGFPRMKPLIGSKLMLVV